MSLWVRCSAALVLTLSVAGSAQQAGTAPDAHAQTQPVPVIRTQANLVLLDVVVTAKGAPVQGLEKASFHVSDNGQPVTPSVFEEHRPGDAPATKAPPDLGPGVYSNLPSYAVGSAANVLLLDSLNTPATNQTQVREQMLDYLRTVPPGTRIAVFTLASRLRLVQGFTADAGQLAEALRSRDGSQTSVRLLGGQIDKDEAAEFARSGASRFAVSILRQFEADNTSLDTDARVRTTIEAFEELARYLRPVPGRKNVVWFSGGFPLSIQPDQTLKNPFQSTREYAEQLRQMDDALSAARVAVYPVDARGVSGRPSASAESNLVPTAVTGGNAQLKADPTPGGSPIPQGETGISKADNDFLAQNAREHDSMKLIAEQTGGKAFIDTNGLAQAVTQAVENGASYYTIGYAPTFKEYDGALHQVKVTVDGKYQTAYRRAYYADDPLKPGHSGVTPQSTLQAAAAPGAPPIAEILFKVRVAPAAAPAVPENVAAAKTPLRRYALDYVVPARALTFTADGDGRQHARVEFVALAYDGAGKRVNAVDQTVTLALPPAEYAEMLRLGVPVEQVLELPAGQFALRMLVRDLASTRVGALEAPLTVP